MKHLWEVGLRRSCRYEVLEYEFIWFFGTNDKRTVERYIGRPEKVISARAGSTDIVRQNVQNGRIAQFNYFNVRKVPAKKGLLEDLGYIKRIKENGQTLFFLNHEMMSCYTEQTALETANPVQEVKEESDSSIDKMCASGLLEEKEDQGLALARANGMEKTLEPKPISITVKELGIKGWLKGER